MRFKTAEDEELEEDWPYSHLPKETSEDLKRLEEQFYDLGKGAFRNIVASKRVGSFRSDLAPELIDERNAYHAVVYFLSKAKEYASKVGEEDSLRAEEGLREFLDCIADAEVKDRLLEAGLKELV